MAKRRRQSRLIIYYLPGIKEKQYLQTPMLKYIWECKQWLLDQKPSAEIISVQPYRSMAIPK